MSSLNEYVEKLHCADEAERIYAAEDIGYLNTAEGVPPLLERLDKERSRAVRDAIFEALIRIDADASIEGSIGLLESEDPQIRNQAVDVLRHKGAQSVPFLNAVMRDGDKDIRKLVLDVLSGIQAIDADAIYEAALSDEDPNVVITAVENLGRTGATQFRRRIEDLLQADIHPMLAGACLEALAGIGDALSLAAIRRRFPDLAALPDFFLVSCLKAVGALGTAREFVEVAGLLAVCGRHLRPAILGALVAIYQRHPAGTPAEDPAEGPADDAAEKQAEDLLPAIRAVVDGGDPPLWRYQAVRALGFLLSRDDVYSFLVSRLSSPERLVRLGAIESLRRSPQPGLHDVLASRATKETDEELLQALGC
jgi:HEAT repeat protein